MYVCIYCTRFSFFTTTPRNWLGKTSPKWPILCWVGSKTLTQSISQPICNILVPTYAVWWQELFHSCKPAGGQTHDLLIACLTPIPLHYCATPRATSPCVYCSEPASSHTSLLSHHTYAGYIVCCVFFFVRFVSDIVIFVLKRDVKLQLTVTFFVRLQISQRWKKVAVWNFACLFDYYMDRSSPIYVNFGLRAAGILSLLQGYTSYAWEKNFGIWATAIQITPGKKFRSEARWAVGIGGGAVVWGCMVGFASCKRADAVV